MGFVNTIWAKALHGQLKTKSQRLETYVAPNLQEGVHILSVSSGCSGQNNFYIWTPFSKIITVMQQRFHNHRLKGNNQDLLGTWIKMHSTDILIPQGYIVLLFTTNSFCLVNFAISSNSHKHIILNLQISQEKVILNPT